MVDKRGAGLSAYTFPITNSRCGREVMQMSVFLALVQTFVAAASLGVALLALERVEARTRHPRYRDVLAASRPLGAKFSRRCPL